MNQLHEYPIPETTQNAFPDFDRGGMVVFASFSANLEQRLAVCREALAEIAKNPGQCDMETGYTSGHIAAQALRITAPRP